MTIFQFNDYRAYLRAHIASLPKRGHGEINRIASHLRVHSSLLSQIFAKTKNLNLEQAQLLSSYLGLNELETDHFLLLVQLERAGTETLRAHWRKKLEATKRESLAVAKRIPQDRTLTDYERSVFYSHWLYSAIRLFCSVGKGKTLDEIASRFEISRARAKEIANFLVETRLCLEKQTRLLMGPQRTHLEAGSPFLPRLHSSWRLKAVERSDGVMAEELMFTAPLSISRADFAKVRELLLDVVKATSKIVESTEAEDVACLELDLLWVGKASSS